MWKIQAQVEGGTPPPFVAKYIGADGSKERVGNGEDAEKVKAELDEAEFVVSGIDRRERRRMPLPPFITSRLQQEAARRFRFTAKRTMMIAQQLYEGVELGEEGSMGLITYMRTDSVRVSNDSIQEAREHIEKNHGKEAVAG